MGLEIVKTEPETLIEDKTRIHDDFELFFAKTK
jgi:hypothetical protein